MDLYGNLHEAMISGLSKTTPVVSFEDAYEYIYQITSRLRDMDDFTDSMITHIKEKINKGESLLGAFKEVINKEYEFANSDYFEPALKHAREGLSEIINRVDNSNDWAAEVNYLADNFTVKCEGKDYTLSQLRDIIEKGGIN